MTPFMKSVHKLVKQNKKRLRDKFLKAKKDDKESCLSLFRPKKSNIYKKKVTDKKNKSL